ncbi:MAG: ATP-binding cassette domain-containing protein [Lachnospiraceae bacterium]|jgi:sodium transport system ATP-binding protein|nr:ATP-binding cassette domain-containing protein [Lachnospiraceae bacterium]
MIRVENLTKQFERNVLEDKKKKRKEEFFAVNHISLEINDGEIVGILGPNGAGKTTLLRMMGGLMEPTDGGVELSDKDGNLITDIVEKKRTIGYLSENTKLYQRLSVREMLRLFGEIYGMEKAEIDERIEKVFQVLELKEFGDNRIGKLSTGQTQRATIARCLLHDPKVYIFDEPTLGLDIISSQAIVNFMKQEKQQGKTVVYSTHYMEEAQYLCDRIYMIHKGKIIANGSPKELMEQTGTDNLRETFFALIGEEKEC